MLDINIFKNSGFFKTRTLNIWEYLFKEWENDDNIYIIITWELVIEKFTSSTKTESKVLATLKNNEIFWEASLNNNLPKQVSIKAKQITQVIFINATTWLEKFSNKYKKEAFSLLKYIIFLSNNRLNESNSLITASYKISKEIIDINNFTSKSIFELIEKIKEIINVSEIIFLEENPVMKEYLVLKYKTSLPWKMQDDVIKVTDNKLDLLELKNLWKYNYMQDIKIGNKNYWYLIFLREENSFTENEIKIISTLSSSFWGLLKQKELLEEQKNKDYIKNS
jgi:hypothetical protein